MASRNHVVEVEGVGSFTFRKRTLELQLRIEADAERITGGPVLSQLLTESAIGLATLRVLLVNGPEGFSLDDVDPFDDEGYSKVLKAYGGLRDAEQTFRRGAAPPRA